MIYKIHVSYNIQGTFEMSELTHVITKYILSLYLDEHQSNVATNKYLQG